jgi:hypothetical protein
MILVCDSSENTVICFLSMKAKLERKTRSVTSQPPCHDLIVTVELEHRLV